MTQLQNILDAPRDAFNVRRVFGDPIEKGETTVIPVAFVAGGSGGGEGPVGENAGAETGAGGGIGGMARPAGVYVIRGDEVAWEPALDVTLIAMAGIALTAVIALTLGKILRPGR